MFQCLFALYKLKFEQKKGNNRTNERKQMNDGKKWMRKRKEMRDIYINGGKLMNVNASLVKNVGLGTSLHVAIADWK